MAFSTSPMSKKVDNGSEDCLVGALNSLDADLLADIEFEDESLEIVNWQLIKATDLESILFDPDLCPIIS